MRVKFLSAIAGAVLFLVGATGSALAHHSFAAEFDADKDVTLEGEVVEFQWVNPHSWLIIDVTTKNGDEVEGEAERWRVEGGAPSALLRRGWNRDSLPAGTKVKVNGFQARNGAPRANATNIVFPDGHELFLGSTGRGAPPEDAGN